MKTFDRHLLREWLQIFGLVVVLTCGLLLMQVLYNDFRTLREDGARGWVLLKYLAATLPSFLNIALPFALLLSLLFTLGKLHRANEFTAMRVAGVGFFRLMVPVWIVGVLCCGVAWWLNTKVVPWSVTQSRLISDELKFNQQAKTVSTDRVGALYSVAFDNQPEGRMWFFNRYSQTVINGQYARKGYGVLVSQLDARRRETLRLLASEAWYDEQRDGWVFKNGREVKFDPDRGAETSEPFTEKFMGSFHEDPELMVLIDRRPIDLSLHELRDLIDYFEAQQSPKSVPYAVRYYSLIADTLGPLIVIAIAIPFAISGVRVNPAVGVSKSIGLFLLYYILANLASSLATKEILSPQVAAWVPNTFLALLAAWLFTRLR